MNTQTLILNSVQATANKLGYIVTDDKKFSNVGLMKFRDNDYDTIVTMKYTFNPTYFVLTLLMGEPTPSKPNGDRHLRTVSTGGKASPSTSDILGMVTFVLRDEGRFANLPESVEQPA